MTDDQEASGLLDLALTRAGERAKLGDLTVQPARDSELERLAADFIARVTAPPPHTFRNADGGGWVVAESSTGNGAQVVVIAEDGSWRLGSTDRRHGAGVELDTRLDGQLRGRPPAAMRYIGIDSETAVDLRDAIAQHVGWLQAPRVTWNGGSQTDLDLARQADQHMHEQLPTLLADALAKLLGEDATRSARLAARRPGETLDPQEAARALTRTLLDELKQAGSPGATAMPLGTRRSLFGKPQIVYGGKSYPLGPVTAVERYERGDPFRPRLELWISPDGTTHLVGEGVAETPVDDIGVAARLYRLAAEHHIRPAVPATLTAHWNWPEAFR